ncbi:MAG: PAS domain S-box protein [Gammaproteobacteria bacterium]|nr:PAS domain S-box protein [Gammaproteobacteria bacterium]
MNKQILPAGQEQSITLAQQLRTGFVIMVIVSIALITLSIKSHYLTFHVLAEFFAIGVAIIMFIVVWNTYPFSKNHYLMFLGCGYFWIAWLDVAHTLTYFGMPTALDAGNYTSQFWIGTRFLESVLLVIAPFYMVKKVQPVKYLITFGVIAALLAYLILGNHFPDTFIPGKGLTAFKVNTEYFIIFIMLLAIGHLYLRREMIDPRIFRLMLISIGLTMGSELAFTFYVSMYGISNLIGHIFKLFSFWLIYMAIIRTTLSEPFAIMARGSSTFNAIPEPTILVQANGTILQVNNAACEVAALSEANLLGMNCHQVFHPQENSSEQCPICQAISKNEYLSDFEINFPQQHQWRQFSITPIEDDHYGNTAIQVSMNVTQRKNAEINSNRANQELRQYAEVAAHQLTEPLRSIASYNQLLLNRYYEKLDDEAKEFFDYSITGVRKLETLLSDLLVYSEIGSNDSQDSQMGAVDLNQLIQDIHKNLDQNISDTNAQIHVDLMPEVQGSRHELMVLFTQLIKNALENSGNKPPEISITVKSISEKKCQITISDNGIGIAKQYQEQIFKLFTRLESIAGDQRTGIGLALAKKIVIHHGGTITVESDENRPTHFRFNLVKYQKET